MAIENLSLLDLESKIKKLYDSNSKNEYKKKKKIERCLLQRKALINKDFRFTPEIVNHIERVNQILTDKTAKVLKKAIELNRQMQAVTAVGDDFLEDYEVEATLKVEYNGEDLHTIEVDENIGQSNYHVMADILYYTDILPYLRSFCFSFRDNTDNEIVEIYSDEMLRLNWNIELLSVPELKHIDYFCWASHLLFCDSLYSISDIIRINTFWAEVDVKWQNLRE
jgi:hypothetical protein